MEFLILNLFVSYYGPKVKSRKNYWDLKLPRFLIDEGLASFGRMSGIGHYIVNLANQLKDFAECDITRYGLLRKIPRYFRKWGYIVTCNIPILYKDYELIHHMANYVPFFRGENKHIMTVHDLSIFRYPETISLAWRHYNAFSFKRSLERADALIAISNSVRLEIQNTFPLLHQKHVFVCYPGIRKSILNAKPDESGVVNLGLQPFSYFLFIGDLTKRKNLGFALQAFIKAKKDKILDEQTQFVVVGKKAWGYSELKKHFTGSSSIKQLGYLNDQQITALYRYAKAFVYPSIYEGFGSPIIEAMSQGTPIIISKIPTSIELNENHNNQMFPFDLGDQEGLIKCFQQIDSNFHSIHHSLNYGDLSVYYYGTVASNHIKIYTTVLSLEKSQ